jgi:hypothetical protein
MSRISNAVRSTILKNAGAVTALAMLSLCSGPALAAEGNCMAS